MTTVQFDCLHFVVTEYDRAHDDTCDGGFNPRTFRALMKGGFVRWDAIARGTVGGWIPTEKGKKKIEESK